MPTEKFSRKSINFYSVYMLNRRYTGSILFEIYSINKLGMHVLNTNKQTPWSQSASELYRPSYRRLSAKLMPTFANRGCRVVSATDPHGRILGFLDRSRYYFFQIVLQLYSRGLVDPVPDPLLLRKSGSAGNRTLDLWICSHKLWPLDHRGCPCARY
jgi:hypothetical protein